MKPFGSAFYIGPHVEEGALPTLFYFALSAEETLQLDPYNQLPVFLSDFPVRIFSMNLPAHGAGLSPLDAIHKWALEIALGKDPITPFILEVKQTIEKLHDLGALVPGKLAAGGISRGAFIATHAAAHIPEIRTLLGFAPLSQLTYTKEFSSLKRHPLAQSLNLEPLIPQIADRTTRFYIGNLDKRVGTPLCFDFIEKLCQHAFAEKKIRSPQIELLIKPSIGHLGHGTGKETFLEGGAWLAEQLGVV